MELSITVIVDNTVYKQGLLAEHGLSLLIECDGAKTLFDTGQGMALLHNMKQLDIDPKAIDQLVLSHSHYDHTNGVRTFLKHSSEKVKVFAHPECFEPCYSKRNENVRSIGLNSKVSSMLLSDKTDLTLVDTPTQLSNNVWLTGTIPRDSKFVPTDRFYSDCEANGNNEVHDDQTLYITTDKGVVVITGCAHAGVVNLVEYVKLLTGQNIYAVIGGMHLIHATVLQRESMANYLLDSGVELVVPLHCSGQVGQSVMAELLAEKCVIVSAGSTIPLF